MQMGRFVGQMPGEPIRELRLAHVFGPFAAVEVREDLIAQHAALLSPTGRVRSVVRNEQHRTPWQRAELRREQTHESRQLEQQPAANVVGERSVDDGDEITRLLWN